MRFTMIVSTPITIWTLILILQYYACGCNAFQLPHGRQAISSERRTPTTSTTKLMGSVPTIEGRKYEGTIKPVNDFILLKVADSQQETDGGILLTQNAAIPKYEGVVKAVGPGKTHVDNSELFFKIDVEVGDSVIYGEYDGTAIKLDGEQHTLIRDDNILVKFKGDEVSVENVNVVSDKVLIEVEPKEEETASGLLLGTSSDDTKRPSTGKVIKVGPGRLAADGSLTSMGVNVGDMVKFRDFAGNEVTIGGKEHCVVKMVDIIAKF